MHPNRPTTRETGGVQTDKEAGGGLFSVQADTAASSTYINHNAKLHSEKYVLYAICIDTYDTKLKRLQLCIKRGVCIHPPPLLQRRSDGEPHSNLRWGQQRARMPTPQRFTFHARTADGTSMPLGAKNFLGVPAQKTNAAFPGGEDSATAHIRTASGTDVA